MRGDGGVLAFRFPVVENCMFLFGWPITLLLFVSSASAFCQDTKAGLHIEVTQDERKVVALALICQIQLPTSVSDRLSRTFGPTEGD